MESQAPQESAGLIGLLAWAEVNKKRLAIAAGAVIVLIAVVTIIFQQQARKEITASEALSEVRISYNPAQPAPPGTADALLKMANEHRGTKAAARALLIGASVLYSERNYEEAQKRYAKLFQDYPTSPWVPEAHLGIAASLNAQGKSADATVKFEEVRKRFANSPAAEEAKLSLGRLYEVQKPEESYKLYEDIARNNPGTSLAAEAEFRKEELVRQRPELARLKEPAVPANLPTAVPMTNRPAITTNLVRRTNMQTITITNRPGATQSAPVQLTPIPALPPSPAPAPGATPPPAPAPPK
jgi:tetratricopeptide (TPR) repeat protein